MNGGHNIVVTVQITELTTQENSLKKKTEINTTGVRETHDDGYLL